MVALGQVPASLFSSTPHLWFWGLCMTQKASCISGKWCSASFSRRSNSILVFPFCTSSQREPEAVSQPWWRTRCFSHLQLVPGPHCPSDWPEHTWPMEQGFLESSCVRSDRLKGSGHRLPREAEDAPSLKVLKAMLDGALVSLVWWVAISPWQGWELNDL